MASNTQLRSLETTISSPNMQYKAPVQQYRALFARDYPGVFTRLVRARLQYYPKHCLSSLT